MLSVSRSSQLPARMFLDVQLFLPPQNLNLLHEHKKSTVYQDFVCLGDFLGN